MAIELDRGNNVVRFSYIDRPLWIGIAISAVAMLLFFALPQFRGSRDRPAGLSG